MRVQRLQLNVGNSAEDDLLEEAIKLAAAEKKKIEAAEAKINCTHGAVSDEYIEGFYEAFRTAMKETRKTADDVVDLFDEVRKATVTDFSDVWTDSTKMATAVQFFVSIGVANFLRGEKILASINACDASFLEQFAKMKLEKTQAVLVRNRFVELLQGDDRTLVSFYRRRIPCSCLDEIYEEVKSIEKKGLCWNLDCSHGAVDYWKNQNRSLLDRSSLMSCSRCRDACYCSVECQIADWPRHKIDCDNTVATRNSFKYEKAKCYRAT